MDGSPHVLDPAASVKLQEELGADVAFTLDDCPPLNSGEKRALLSAQRTTKWAEESKQSRRSKGTLLFGIMQGGLFPPTREEHARTIAEMEFDGYGIGGLGLGEPKEQTLAMAAASLKGLP
ncbi:MAG: tRNA-guanine transglycosylase, partial [Candidatus Aenigmatarchaeota archaeon]